MGTDWRVEERLREKLALLSQELSETQAALDAVRADLAASEEAREAWTETARMHAKNEAYYRDLIVRTLSGTPAAFVSDDGSVQQDVICAKLPELYEASEKAREEAERRFAVISPAGHAIDYAAWVAAMDQIERHRLDFTNCADVGRRMEVRALAAESRAERLEEKVRRVESACGLPDPAEACRVILAIAAEEGK